jgi:hypothetical protein
MDPPPLLSPVTNPDFARTVGVPLDAPGSRRAKPLDELRVNDPTQIVRIASLGKTHRDGLSVRSVLVGV